MGRCVFCRKSYQASRFSDSEHAWCGPSIQSAAVSVDFYRFRLAPSCGTRATVFRYAALSNREKSWIFPIVVVSAGDFIDRRAFWLQTTYCSEPKKARRSLFFEMRRGTASRYAAT